MTDLIAIIAIIWWPLIPLFWIPVHGFSGWVKKLGLYTYILPLITWLPAAFVIYSHKEFLLQYRIELSTVLNIAGWLLFFLGTLLHVWTGFLLNMWGLIGLPEISNKFKGAMVTTGPFSVVRHPTYLAHTLMFTGVFLLSEVIAAGFIAVLDFIIVFTIIIPLEERELLKRFGDDYRKYSQSVPRFFPITLLRKKT